MYHGVSVESMMCIGGRPAAEVGSDAVEGAPHQGRRHPRPLQLSQLNIVQLCGDGHPVPGHVAASGHREQAH